MCESNAPLTSKTPIAGFEDRESHRTPFASAVVTANAGTVAWVSGVRSSCRVKLGLAINQTAVPRTVAETGRCSRNPQLIGLTTGAISSPPDFLRPCLEDRNTRQLGNRSRFNRRSNQLSSVWRISIVPLILHVSWIDTDL